ncbi:uncharacterized protein JCM15063_001799 [Sporobolomyces koalae]|uniref:uncharacterized protein n=1 Tax=Sporobolomyces koalae TaxID=500713 RepID=UPI0031760889
MSFLRPVLPHLTHVAPSSRVTLVRFPLPSTISTSASSRAASARLFSSTTRTETLSRTRKASPFANLHKAFQSKRSIQTSPVYAGQQGTNGSTIDWRKVGINVGFGVAGAIALNFALNRETRGPLAGFEGEYLRSTFKWTGAGLAITASTAYLAFTNGIMYRMMAMNPWVVMGGGLVLSIGSMYGVMATAPDSPAHYGCWALFSMTQGLTLSPMCMINPAILGRAALYTAGAVGGISYVGATAKSDQYLWLGGPLLAGLGVLICSSLAPMIMPRMSLRALTTLETVGAYGGTAVFSGFILYDTQKILKHAQLAQRGAIVADPVRESVSLILDVASIELCGMHESFAVIGGEGFLGAALVAELLERHPTAQVASLGLTQRRFEPPSYRFYRTDITSLDSLLSSLEQSGATTVFHTASPHANASPAVWQSVNVEGTKIVVEACKRAHVRKLVFTSSATVAFENDALKNVDERIPTIDIEGERGEPTYASTKAKAERIVLDANGQDGLLTCSLRLGGIIGPGDRQVIPGFIDVCKAHQSSFQMGSNKNLFDFVTVRNVVHAHILAAEKLDAPPLPTAILNERLPPVSCTIKRRTLPTSRYPEVVKAASDLDNGEGPLPAARNRFNQFHEDALPAEALAEGLTVAGQSYFISNGEPVPFWSFARSVYYAYSGSPTRFVIEMPASMGMVVARVCELAGALVGKRPEQCAINQKYMQYVLNDMYFDIERARKLLGYEPIETLEEGVRSAVEWYKADEQRAKARAAEAGSKRAE